MRLKVLILSLMLCCLISLGCSENENNSLSMELLTLTQDTTSSLTSIHKLSVSDDSLILHSTPYFSFSSNNYDSNTILYWNSDKIVVSQPSFTTESTSDTTILSANSTDLFYNNWSLEYIDDTWILANPEIGYSNEFVFEADNRTYSPICLYMDVDTSYIHVLCNSLTVANDFSVNIFIIDVNTGAMDYVCCDDSFHQYDISPVQYPLDSFYCSPLSDGFLYNEGVRIFKINGKSGELQILFDEDMIMNDIPLKDSYRDIYSFFDSVSFRNNHYTLSLPAYNELTGWYVAFYDSTLIYKGCIHITETKIALYDPDNNIVCDLEGTFHAYCYT